MEDLKLLIELMVGLPKLPSSTLFIIFGYLFYKLVVIGFIYGFIYCGIKFLKLHYSKNEYNMIGVCTDLEVASRLE